MSGMKDYLKVAFGDQGQAEVPADSEKVAHMQMFCKLAADNGVDLSTLNDEQVNSMLSTFVAKLASDEGHEEKKDEKEHMAPPFGKKHEDEKKEKEAAAQREFAAQKEWSEKLAEADHLGRTMARSYADELQKLAGVKIDGTTKAAGAFAAAMKVAGKEEKEEKKEHEKEEKEHEHGKAPPFGKKEASALDEMAAFRAVEMAIEAGLDKELTIRKIAAVLELGPPESTKLAAAESYAQGRDIRALELLEAAGFPVTWTA